jgi:hypothetical protein
MISTDQINTAVEILSLAINEYERYPDNISRQDYVLRAMLDVEKSMLDWRQELIAKLLEKVR